jgi:hypothetical protein
VDRICFPDRRKSVHGVPERNFLRFCNPAALRKPVMCLSWQIPFDVYVSPMFRTPRRTSKRSACDEFDKSRRVSLFHNQLITEKRDAAFAAQRCRTKRACP